MITLKSKQNQYILTRSIVDRQVLYRYIQKPMLSQLPTLLQLCRIKLEGIDVFHTQSFALAMEFLVYETLFPQSIKKMYDCISIDHRKGLCMMNYRTREGTTI